MSEKKNKPSRKSDRELVELAAAEHWQYDQAFATWDAVLRGDDRTVAREDIQRIFARALEPET